ncbi:hypothetical protein [Bosea sp. ASV33]|uniref:hypothetical protein n=1 Tax=Bosea sp. ASV33 TaxID=2795106 RepID=UPI0018EC04CB|nr:hypothetical protein [Bosea sp. ASV33]
MPHSTLEALAAGAYELLKPICGSRAYLHILNRKSLPLRHAAFITTTTQPLIADMVSLPEIGIASKTEQVIVIFS